MERLIMTPDDQGFWETLHTAPPPGDRVSPFFVVDSQTYELVNVSDRELLDYSLGGEEQTMREYWEHG